MKMNQTLLKYIGILALITFLSAIGVRVFTGGESLADYAEKNPDIAYMEPIPADDPAQKDRLTNPETEPAVQKPSEHNASDTVNNTLPENKPSASKGGDMKAENDTHTTTEPETETQPDVQKDAVAADSRIIYQEGFYYEELPDDVITRITGISYKENPHIALSDLRYVKVLYHDFSSETQVGELICNQAIAKDLTEIFYELYQNDYQIERIALVDEYGGDDTLSMEANNTSCFNYRVVDGTTRLSKHALGLAIDINPFYNPYIVYNKDGTGETYISPKGSELYADRSQRFPYKIDADDLCYRLFKEHGFTWGGNWNSTKDYQHFQKAID